MSKSVTIPSTMSPRWVCEINGRVYSYDAGTTATVPDEVAALIADIAEMTPAEAPEAGTQGQVWKRLSKGAGWADEYRYNLSAATSSAIGGVKQGASVADASGDAPTAAEFKALLDSLRTAGIIATET